MNVITSCTSDVSTPLHPPAGAASATHRLIQRVGGVEAPAAGRWLLHRTSSMVLTSARRPRALHARDGWLEMATLPDASALAIVADGEGMCVSLHAVACELSADGADTWIFAGRSTDGGIARDVAMTFTYHGVHRHGDTGFVRLTGLVATPPVGRRWRRTTELALAMDLLFEAPVETVADGRATPVAA